MAYGVYMQRQKKSASARPKAGGVAVIAPMVNGAMSDRLAVARAIAARSNPASSRSSVSGSVDYHPSNTRRAAGYPAGRWDDKGAT
jgi:hypothetical protein